MNRVRGTTSRERMVEREGTCHEVLVARHQQNHPINGTYLFGNDINQTTPRGVESAVGSEDASCSKFDIDVMARLSEYRLATSGGETNVFSAGAS